MTTYWRVQGPLDRLSRSFRSRVHSTGVEEDGTSCCYTLADVFRWAHSYPVAPFGEIELIQFEGDEVSVGCDGEPVVIPTRELARWEHLNWAASRWLHGDIAETEDDLVLMGWTRIAEEGVDDA